MQKEIESLEARKKQAEALFMKCEGGIEVLKKMIEDDKPKDKSVDKK